MADARTDLVDLPGEGLKNAPGVTEWGYGQHAADLPPNIVHSPGPLKLYWLNQILFQLTTLLTKLSLCYTYAHLFRQANSRLVRTSGFINALTALLVLTYYSAAFFVCIFECSPISKSWRPHEEGRCTNLRAFRYATAVANLVTSVLVIATPLPVVFRMRQQRSEVREVIFLLLLGLVCVLWENLEND
ncbi:MAG: hypothetical protein LQ347_003928 [Umbilicaria vellea]|nr:MAG: hypothetical protein LQ347_003928 [Umbilicaria vellea]